MDEFTITELVKPIIDHDNFLCSDDCSFLMKLFANIIQSPG